MNIKLIDQNEMKASDAKQAVVDNTKKLVSQSNMIWKDPYFPSTTPVDYPSGSGQVSWTPMEYNFQVFNYQVKKLQQGYLVTSNNLEYACATFKDVLTLMEKLEGETK